MTGTAVVIEWVALTFGAGIVAVTASSVFGTLLVPRSRQSVLTNAVGKVSLALGQAAAKRAKDFETADRRLALIGPSTIVLQLLAWTAGFLAGFSLALLPFVDHLGLAVREAASSMLTLGFATTISPGATVVDLLAGLSGFGLITIQIAYLPTLYDAFNRRERLVTMLESRAGSPPWGPELLARHKFVGIEDGLSRLWQDWELWAADIAESHTNYPTLLTLRSPHVRRFWLLSLLAVLDAAAMHLALNPSTAPTSARLCLRMGFTSLRDIARTVGVPYDPDPRPDDPIRLTFEEFAEGAAHAAARLGEHERTAEEAWADFRGWRVNYESIALDLAWVLGAPPCRWSGPRWFAFEQMDPSRPVHRRPDDPEGLEQGLPPLKKKA